MSLKICLSSTRIYLFLFLSAPLRHGIHQRALRTARRHLHTGIFLSLISIYWKTILTHQNIITISSPSSPSYSPSSPSYRYEFRWHSVAFHYTNEHHFSYFLAQLHQTILQRHQTTFRQHRALQVNLKIIAYQSMRFGAARWLLLDCTWSNWSSLGKWNRKLAKNSNWILITCVNFFRIGYNWIQSVSNVTEHTFLFPNIAKLHVNISSK